MKTSTQIITTLAAALALGAGGLVFAQQGPAASAPMGQGAGMGKGMGMHGEGRGTGDCEGKGQGQGPGRQHGPQSAADLGARLAAVKAELQLSSAQEPAWQKYEAVVRQQAEARQAQRTAMQATMQDPAKAASIDHAALRESMMKARDAERAVQEAARKELFAVLTPEQQAAANQRMGAGRGHRMGGMHRHAG